MREAGLIENGVLVGHRGHLFLAGGAHDVLNYTTGAMKAPEASFRNFEANILSRQLSAERLGIPYRHMIFPDKQSVMRDAFPLGDPVCLGEAYLARCEAIRPMTFYPLELLRNRQEGCFLHTDTHLSDRGGLSVANAIMRELTGTDYHVVTEQMLATVTREKENCGDLGSKLMPPQSMMESYLARGWGARIVSNRLVRNDGIVDIWLSPSALTPGRLLILGDSFGRDLARLISRFFQETIFLRTPYFFPEIVAQISPTYLLTQNVERYLTFVRRDADRPAFHMYPYIGGATRSEPDPEFGEVFSAELSHGRQPYKTFRTKYFEQAIG